MDRRRVFGDSGGCGGCGGGFGGWFRFDCSGVVVGAGEGAGCRGRGSLSVGEGYI